MFNLPSLPYGDSALEPHISARTLSFHYGKHHRAYIDNLNKLIAGSDLEKESLENIVKQTANQPEKAAIFNNAAQAYNHSFFWQCLRPAAEIQTPDSELEAAVASAFGSLANFLDEFKDAAAGVFGSGWVWLASDGGVLKIMKTANADNPLAHSLKPLFVLDVWEHAYYLDYQNRRADFTAAVLANLINWNFIAANWRA